MKSVISYNVNGLRAATRKGFMTWFRERQPDVLCLQELKAMPDDLDPEVRKPEGYDSFFMPAEKKGYSGVAIYTRLKPVHVEYGCGIEKYDREGRVIRVDFKDFSVMSLYLPSGTTGEERQGFKEQMLGDFYKYIKKLRTKIPNLIISGDFNICHKPIDIHNPVSNANSSGYLPHEREWVTQFLDLGYVDSFRHFYPDLKDQYTWWTFRAGARGNNKGWRIDYHLVSESFIGKCADHKIYKSDEHSDHCGLELLIKD
jgi:exodeoxyribonuclease III